jgi:hypothetical protein
MGRWLEIQYAEMYWEKITEGGTGNVEFMGMKGR